MHIALKHALEHDASSPGLRSTLNACLKVNNINPDLHVALRCALMHDGTTKNLQKELRKALQVPSNQASADLHESLKIALQASPKSKLLKQALEQTLNILGNQTSAHLHEALKIVLGANSEDQSLQHTLAQVFSVPQNQDNKSLRMTLKNALKAVPDSPELHNALMHALSNPANLNNKSILEALDAALETPEGRENLIPVLSGKPKLKEYYMHCKAHELQSKLEKLSVTNLNDQEKLHDVLHEIREFADQSQVAKMLHAVYAIDKGFQKAQPMLSQFKQHCANKGQDVKEQIAVINSELQLLKRKKM